MSEGVFTIAAKRPIREEMTISRNTGLGTSNSATWFSLGAGTSITPESYDTMSIYIGAAGTGTFLIGEQPETMDLHPDEILLVPEKTLCGVKTGEGCIYTEIITKKENTMNDLVKAKEVLNLKELISYEEGSIANVDIGNAILTALEGTAVIGYEGTDYTLNAGESFRFEKNGLHSVTAKGRFKMSLLLVLE